MQHLLNYKAFNRELLEPHLREMRRDSTQSKTKTAKEKKGEGGGGGACIHNAREDNLV